MPWQVFVEPFCLQGRIDLLKSGNQLIYRLKNAEAARCVTMTNLTYYVNVFVLDAMIPDSKLSSIHQSLGQITAFLFKWHLGSHRRITLLFLIQISACFLFGFGIAIRCHMVWFSVILCTCQLFSFLLNILIYFEHFLFTILCYIFTAEAFRFSHGCFLSFCVMMGDLCQQGERCRKPRETGLPDHWRSWQQRWVLANVRETMGGCIVSDACYQQLMVLMHWEIRLWFSEW